jgi:hypothetical protein
MSRLRILLITILSIGSLFLGYRHGLLPYTGNIYAKESKASELILTRIKDSPSENEERIVYLKEARKIENGFSAADGDYFENITSICLDGNDDLYIADSGAHKIFKFNACGKYLFSFGKMGQDTAEFLGTLRISIGNDAMVYITDDENWRLYVYDKGGHFIRQFPIYKYIYDTALVNSHGDIYFLSPSGTSLVDYYDNKMNLKGSLVEYSLHLDFPYRIPSARLLKAMSRPSIIDLKKLMTKEDELILISNNSLCVYILDNNNKIENNFRITHRRLIENYKKRLAGLQQEGAWLQCFGSAFLDNKESICLCYCNTDIKQPEIYRYNKKGILLDVLRIILAGENPSLSNRAIDACDSKGNMYAIESTLQKIIIYGEKGE